MNRFINCPFVFLLPIWMLLLPTHIEDIIVNTIVYFVLGILIQRHRITFQKKSLNDISIILDIILGLSFFGRWFNSSKVALVAAAFGMNSNIFLTILSILLVACSFNQINWLINYLSNVDLKVITIIRREIVKVKIRDILFIALVAVFVITVCSTSSPVYSFNQWVDSNAFFTVGKSMLKGYIPYKDLYDHKGPLLFFIHAIGALISYNSFLGIYFFEIISAIFFLFFSYKISLLSFERNIIVVIPFLAYITYAGEAFVLGDSVEEFCLPLLAYGLYVSIKMFKFDKFPSTKEAILIGITSGGVLWMKYTILGFYIGWIIIPCYMTIREKKFREFLRLLAGIVAGVVVITLPIIMYFTFNNALCDMFEVYFYDNMFLYSAQTNSNTLINLISVGVDNVLNNKMCILLIIIGIVTCKNQFNNRVYVNILFIIFCTFFFIYFSGVAHAYYSLIFSCFAILGLNYLFIYLRNIFIYGKSDVKIIVSMFIAFLLIIVSCPNIENIKYEEMDYAQYQIKAAIESFNIDNPKILNYNCLDQGVYTVTGVVPTERIYYVPNMKQELFKNIQDSYIEANIFDFIVSIEEYSFSNYKYISQYSGVGTVLYLYHKV